MRKPKPVSIYSIGVEAGVSAATVSRALKNHPGISSGMREKIRTIADRHAFKPSYISNRVLNICVLVQQIRAHPLDFGPFLARVLEGIAEYCKENQLEMSILGATAADLNSKDSTRELRRRGANGAVVLRATSESKYLTEMKKQAFPYYCLFHQSANLGKKTFSVDDQKLAATAVHHLIQLGHQHIGIITDSIHFKHQELRLNGYCQALQAAGLEASPRYRYVFSEKSLLRPTHAGQLGIGMSGIAKLMQNCSKMTAVFCSTDLIAEGALCWLHEQHIKVPERLSVVGFDDYPSSAYFCPPLTTIHVPLKEIAYEAARQVHLQCLHSWKVNDNKVFLKLTGKLTVRQSSAQPQR